MSKPVKKAAVIVEKQQLIDGIYSIWLEEESIAKVAKAGQFVSVYVDSKDHLLPRPISICEVDQEEGRIRLVYRVAGEGTKEISQKNVGELLWILGPLGNGYTLEGKKAILVGGGIGIPPMLQLAKELPCEKVIVLGYRNQDTFLDEEFKKYGEVIYATDDGSIGTKGTVIDAMNENQLDVDVIFACGPKPMLKGIKEYAKEHEIKAQISLEERMACGIGACLGCVCKSKEKDSHSHVNNKRVCKDGPVFDAEEVEL